MTLSESRKVTTYHVQVKETIDQQLYRWVGSLTLIPQDNGETFLEISFIDQEVLTTPPAPSFDHKALYLSIDYLDD